MKILDEYSQSFPSPQTALDIFKGEWSSRLPDDSGATETGASDLFADARVEWGVEQLGGVGGKRVLELGPLEAGHTYMLEQLGAESIHAVEANKRAFLKCLIVKEILGLRAARFLHGDCLAYLRECETTFDVCIASGILYHMVNPVELIGLASRVTDRLFIWTHYYDHEVIGSGQLRTKFSRGRTASWDGFEHTLFEYKYQDALDWNGFCGGSQPAAAWLTRDDILRSLAHYGFDRVATEFETPQHPNGPCLCLAAVRTGEAGGEAERLRRSETELSKARAELDRAQGKIERLQEARGPLRIWRRLSRRAPSA